MERNKFLNYLKERLELMSEDKVLTVGRLKQVIEDVELDLKREKLKELQVVDEKQE